MREIPLSNGGVALADDADFALVSQHRWRWLDARPGKRAVTTVNDAAGSHLVYMHRLITGAVRGERVDHASADGLDNRRENLRRCSQSQNCANWRMTRGKTSRFRGVSKRARNARFRAHIKVNQQIITLGTFLTEEDAARAYDRAAREHFGEFARLNFPEQSERAATRKETAPAEL